MQERRELSRADDGEGPSTLDRSLDLVRFLRAGCPWDARQTPDSLTPYLIEEALELVDAITDANDAAIRDELGDLLLNVAFQIVLAEERGAFEAWDVVERLEEKMRRRHPHLYGAAEDRPAWEELKAHEREREDVFEGLARRLDPLSRAQRIQDRAAGLGFDWEDWRGAFEKLREEVEELAEQLELARDSTGDDTKDATATPHELAGVERELGDLLFSCVNVARLTGLHASKALRHANARFERRFSQVRDLASARGIDMKSASLLELDELWEEAKRMSNVEPSNVEPSKDEPE